MQILRVFRVTVERVEAVKLLKLLHQRPLNLVLGDEVRHGSSSQYVCETPRSGEDKKRRLFIFGEHLIGAKFLRISCSTLTFESPPAVKARLADFWQFDRGKHSRQDIDNRRVQIDPRQARAPWRAPLPRHRIACDILCPQSDWQGCFRC